MLHNYDVTQLVCLSGWYLKEGAEEDVMDGIVQIGDEADGLILWADPPDQDSNK